MFRGKRGAQKARKRKAAPASRPAAVPEEAEVPEEVEVPEEGVRGGRWCRCRECAKPACGTCKHCTNKKRRQKCLKRPCIWKKK